MRIAPPTPPPPYVGDDALHVETAATCGRTAHDGLQNRAAHAAADNSSNGIADRPQTLVLQRSAGDIAADRTADRFDNQASDIGMLLCLAKVNDILGLKC